MENLFCPKDHWTLKTGYFEDPDPAIQVQTLPLEGPRSLGCFIFGTKKYPKRSKLWCPAHGRRWWRWSRQPWLQQQSSPGAMRPCSTRLSSRSWAWRMCSTATWQGPKIDFLRITTSDCLMVWWFCFEIYWLSQWLTFKLLGTTYL